MLLVVAMALYKDVYSYCRSCRPCAMCTRGAARKGASFISHTGSVESISWLETVVTLCMQGWSKHWSGCPSWHRLHGTSLLAVCLWAGSSPLFYVMYTMPIPCLYNNLHTNGACHHSRCILIKICQGLKRSQHDNSLLQRLVKKINSEIEQVIIIIAWRVKQRYKHCLNTFTEHEYTRSRQSCTYKYSQHQ